MRHPFTSSTIALFVCSLLGITQVVMPQTAQAQVAKLQGAKLQGVKSNGGFVFSHPITSAGHQATTAQKGVGAIRIIALRVDFPQEGADSGLTTGNGQFDLSTRFRLMDRDTVIDPPPHDSNYFLAHFRFLNDYFTKVSRNKLTVESELLPGVVHLSKQMKFYSPTKFDTKNVPLAEMVREAWGKADSLGLLAPLADVIDTSRTMFVLLHAGAGRDIDLQSTFGFDPTPHDIPSIYFSEQALKDALGDRFSGITVAGGKFQIRNTAVLPEAETRTIPNPQNTQQTLVIQLGMNGLAASQVGSFLGLPDLFNTQTGKTAVGQIALMDGAGIFGYGGLFPPEPMAWEKIRLGWISPIEVTSDQLLSIYTPVYAADNNVTDSTVYKIPLSADEYYLLEVRRRDARADGAKFSTYQNTQGLDRPFNYLLDPKQESNPDSISGVLMSADEYDWAMFADRTKGGIAIWHVDESIIRAKESTDAINADFDHRGIRMVEADAIPDIGFTYSNPLGEFTESGRQNDLWFYNNSDRTKNDPSHVNELSQSSLPATLLNTGILSPVRLDQFSPPNNLMTVRFTRTVGIGEVQLLPGFPATLGGAMDSVINGIVANGTGYLFSVANQRAGNTSTVFGWRSNAVGGWDMLSASGLLTTGYHIRELAIREQPQGLSLYTTEDSAGVARLALYSFTSATNTLAFANAAPLTRTTTALLVRGDSIVVANGDAVEVYSSDLLAKISSTAGFGTIRSIAATSGGVAIATDSTSSSNGILAVRSKNGVAEGKVLQSAGEAVVAFDSSTSCVFDLQGEQEHCFEGAQHLAIGDVNSDGVDDIVLSNNTNFAAMNYAGVPVSNLYLSNPNSRFTGNAVILDLQGEGNDIAMSVDGKLTALNGKTGKQVQGFPLASGDLRSLLALKVQDKIMLVGLADTSTVLAWSAKAGSGPVIWGGPKADAALTMRALPSTSTTTSTEFFPSKRAYVWPNPVEDGSKAHLRMFVSEDASADCLIVNDAGERIASLKADLVGGTDNEILWDTKPLYNGVYTCRVKVESKKSGQSGTKLIKIAVVK